MSYLTIHNHSRNFASFSYVYPVVSRRSEGLSLGINLNTNNACNWRCIYCQVENLIRGKPEDIDLVKFEDELDYMLNWIIKSDFIEQYVDKELQRFNDISLSGNGEPTLSNQFLPVVKIIAKLRLKYQLKNQVKTVLITNGSLIDKPDILVALDILRQNNGEIWFKVDSASLNGISKINQVKLSLTSIKNRIKLAASKCTTYIQTCFFKLDQLDPDILEIEKYIAFIADIKSHIAGVLLYSTARNPALAEGKNISPVTVEFLANIAGKLRELGIVVRFYP